MQVQFDGLYSWLEKLPNLAEFAFKQKNGFIITDVLQPNWSVRKPCHERYFRVTA